jgi:2-C-methyl-D-erythritol 4-phosphate cytidylyltransferase
MKNQPKVGAVIVAAGLSERMGRADKLMMLVGEKPILARVASTFQNSSLVNQIVIVLSEPNLEQGIELVKENGWSKVSDICPGSRRRQDSVAAGLDRLQGCQWVVIHDGTRPFVTDDLISRGLEAAKETGAAAAAVPVTDTIKIAGDDMFVRETPARKHLWAVQTPQVFRHDIITSAHHQIDNEVTDDASLVEQLGYRVKLYMGAYDNIKITTPSDLDIAEVLLKKHGK